MFGCNEIGVSLFGYILLLGSLQCQESFCKYNDHNYPITTTTTIVITIIIIVVVFVVFVRRRRYHPHPHHICYIVNKLSSFIINYLSFIHFVYLFALQYLKLIVRIKVNSKHLTRPLAVASAYSTVGYII